MDISGCTILVTGGNGCIGKEVVKFLLAESPKKIIVIGRRTNLDSFDLENIEYSTGDICNFQYMDEKLKGVDILVHLAAKVHSLPQNTKDEEEFYRVNTKASEDIFNLAILHQLKKVVFISSVAVFGDKGESLISEEDVCRPTSPYGKSKLMAEQFLTKISSENKLDMTILRPVTVFGNFDKGNIANFIKLLKRGIGVRVGVGNQMKSFVHSKDMAAAIVETSKNTRTQGQVYIISGFSIRLIDFIEKVKGVFCLKSYTIAIPISIIKIMKNINKRLYIKLSVLGSTNLYDGNKFTNETGFKVKYNLEEGLKDSFDFYQSL